MTIVWTVCAFLSGSFMFSYWLGLIAKKNLKTVGDGNPGALNLWKAAGYKLGVVVIILDFLKGYLILLFILGYEKVQGYSIISISLAPIIGHAFSPFLKGKGGKAIAVTFGVWSALSSFEASLAFAVVLAILLSAIKVINRGKSTSTEADGLQVVVGFLLLGAYLYMRDYSDAILWVWLGNFLLLVYTHRYELAVYLKRR
ncbi:glycerol-3-phosphate acyltransferase [Paenibacillus alginolyticus]|uniref:Glycerol-3-phosphate acyltransferase n=1 Tax=Paenibacillus alginolyticus TaxID=59839 RepID=A0ABT4GN25_9BACL|nr:glycerol-3-phosphate acyltransferase [Paenibacillus alginolyticus]MCY9697419.1 glycerol-3-phosphate acyltransferase [Paenibacillus alginolyticus]MEC0141881.1 glycerol-3-phosphate acyltransferase [Paenibacillus alginolyticus]